MFIHVAQLPKCDIRVDGVDKFYEQQTTWTSITKYLKRKLTDQNDILSSVSATPVCKQTLYDLLSVSHVFSYIYV